MGVSPAAREPAPASGRCRDLPARERERPEGAGDRPPAALPPPGPGLPRGRRLLVGGPGRRGRRGPGHPPPARPPAPTREGEHQGAREGDDGGRGGPPAHGLAPAAPRGDGHHRGRELRAVHRAPRSRGGERPWRRPRRGRRGTADEGGGRRSPDRRVRALAGGPARHRGRKGRGGGGTGPATAGGAAARGRRPRRRRSRAGAPGRGAGRRGHRAVVRGAAEGRPRRPPALLLRLQPLQLGGRGDHLQVRASAGRSAGVSMKISSVFAFASWVRVKSSPEDGDVGDEGGLRLGADARVGVEPADHQGLAVGHGDQGLRASAW